MVLWRFSTHPHTAGSNEIVIYVCQFVEKREMKTFNLLIGLIILKMLQLFHDTLKLILVIIDKMQKILSFSLRSIFLHFI